MVAFPYPPEIHAQYDRLCAAFAPGDEALAAYVRKALVDPAAWSAATRNPVMPDPCPPERVPWQAFQMALYESGRLYGMEPTLAPGDLLRAVADMLAAAGATKLPFSKKQMRTWVDELVEAEELFPQLVAAMRNAGYATLRFGDRDEDDFGFTVLPIERVDEAIEAARAVGERVSVIE